MKLLLSFIIFITACGASAATIRNRAVDSANASIEMTVKVYRGEGLVCVERAETKADAEKCIKDVHKRYEPIWKAWEDFRKAEDQAAAWCTFAKTLPEDLRPKAVEGIPCL